jgi:hypothetical protein
MGDVRFSLDTGVLIDELRARVGKDLCRIILDYMGPVELDPALLESLIGPNTLGAVQCVGILDGRHVVGIGGVLWVDALRVADIEWLLNAPGSFIY